MNIPIFEACQAKSVISFHTFLRNASHVLAIRNMFDQNIAVRTCSYLRDAFFSVNIHPRCILQNDVSIFNWFALFIPAVREWTWNLPKHLTIPTELKVIAIVLAIRAAYSITDYPVLITGQKRFTFRALSSFHNKVKVIVWKFFLNNLPLFLSKNSNFKTIFGLPYSVALFLIFIFSWASYLVVQALLDILKIKVHWFRWYSMTTGHYCSTFIIIIICYTIRDIWNNYSRNRRKSGFLLNYFIASLNLVIA